MSAFGYVHLFFFGVFIPYAAWRSKKRVAGAAAAPDFRAHQLSTMATLIVFAGFSLSVALVEGIEIFPPRVPSLTSIAAGVVALVAMILFMRPRWRTAVEKRTKTLRMFIPRDATQRVQWIVVATLAGISEEITWRGVQFALIERLVHVTLLAALISAISFAIGHVIQGWRSVTIVFVFALVFQSLVWLAGSLYVAMAVHLLYDIIAGLNYARLARELNYDDVTPP